MQNTAPEFGKKAYRCPHCGVLSQMQHAESSWNLTYRMDDSSLNPVKVSFCVTCQNGHIWSEGRLVFPLAGQAPRPNPDMPKEILALYLEADEVAVRSPRAAAALLRLAIQLLCKQLGGDGKNISADIKKLVENGLPSKIQRALDVVRVVGNNAVHPGQIDADNPAMARSLFVLINLIVEHMISLPAQVDDLYDALPETAQQAIERRDKETGGD